MKARTKSAEDLADEARAVSVAEAVSSRVLRAFLLGNPDAVETAMRIVGTVRSTAAPDEDAERACELLRRVGRAMQHELDGDPRSAACARALANLPPSLAFPPNDRSELGRGIRNAYKAARVPLQLRVAEGGIVEDLAVEPVDAIRLGEIFRPPTKRPPVAKR